MIENRNSQSGQEAPRQTNKTQVIVEFLVQRRMLIPHAIRPSIISSISRLISPVEEKYSGRWNRDAESIAKAREEILSNLKMNLLEGERGKSDEVDTLGDLLRNVQQKYKGERVKKSQSLVENVVEDTFKALTAGWSTPAELQTYLGANSGGKIFASPTRHTRSGGIDSNPPDSRSKWRTE